LSDLDRAVTMAKHIESAGIRILELNVGTPYASQSAKGAVSTELLPERIEAGERVHRTDLVRRRIRTGGRRRVRSGVVRKRR
jgi:hypothetical protein